VPELNVVCHVAFSLPLSIPEPDAL
jgi:hypothetical protein